MKSSDSQKLRVSSLFPPSMVHASSTADIYKLELDNEMTKVEQILTNEYTSASRLNSRENESTFKEEKVLKNNLNRLRSENKLKENKIQGLEDMIKCFNIISPRNQSALLTFHSTMPENDRLDLLKQKLIQEDIKIEEEERNTEVLIETKNKTLQNTLVWKERLGSLIKIDKDIEKKYSEALDSKQKAVYSLISIQNKIIKLKKYMDINKNKFNAAIDKKILIKQNQEKEVKESIDKISRVNIKSRENKSNRVQVLKKLEERISSNTLNTEKVKESNQIIDLIRRQLELIKSYIPGCKEFSEPLTPSDINFIIESYSKFKFQEHSLSIKFGDLTEEQHGKQQKCDEIREELYKLKKENDFTVFNENKPSLTYNQLESVTDKDVLSKKTVTFKENIAVIIKIYLQILNLGSIIYKALNSIHQYSSFHQTDNEFSYSFDIIKKSQQAFALKQEKGLKDSTKKLRVVEKSKTFKTEVENFDDLINFSISLPEIQEVLARYIKESKTLVQLSSLIKSDTLSCYFLDISDIEMNIAMNMNNFMNFVVDINVTANKVFKERYFQVTSAFFDIIIRLSKLSNQNKLEISEFYRKNKPNMLEFFENSISLNKNPKKESKNLEYSIKNGHNKGPKRNSDEISNQFKIIDTAKTLTEEKNIKSRQEIPLKSEPLSKASSREILNELNSIRNKISELKSIERRVQTTSLKGFSIDDLL